MNGYDHFVGSNAMNLITLYLNFTSCGVICKLKKALFLAVLMEHPMFDAHL